MHLLLTHPVAEGKNASLKQCCVPAFLDPTRVRRKKINARLRKMGLYWVPHIPSSRQKKTLFFYKKIKHSFVNNITLFNWMLDKASLAFVNVLRDKFIIPLFKGLFNDFTRGVHGTVYSSKIGLTLRAFHFFHPCGHCGRFYGLRARSKWSHSNGAIGPRR